jgi:hypothetical protein
MDSENYPIATAFPKAEMRPLAGRTELAVAEAMARPGSRPEKVTWILQAVYETIAGQPATLDLIRALPSGSREWLLQQAAYWFHPDLNWFEAICSHCGHVYDISLKLADAMRYQPERWQTRIEVETSLGKRSFAIPSGAHEEAHARAGHGADPRRSFAALCGLSVRAPEEAVQFDDNDLALIDAALEAASPDVSDVIQAACPTCGLKTSARIDPLLFAFPEEGSILREIHLIASRYGWRYGDILELNRRHRAFYATLIARQHRPAVKTAHRRTM